MIRPARYVTETCHTCKREGWTRLKRNSLLTQEEWDYSPIVVKGLPAGFEPMTGLCGSSIGEAIQEAKDYCKEYKVPGVGFEFNGASVFVTASSDTDKLYRDWWQEVYHETPEESFKRR